MRSSVIGHPGPHIAEVVAQASLTGRPIDSTDHAALAHEKGTLLAGGRFSTVRGPSLPGVRGGVPPHGRHHARLESSRPCAPSSCAAAIVAV